MARTVFTTTRSLVNEMRLNNIYKIYDDQNCALNNFSYNFEKGKVYVIKGISGCGKTTLLNIIGGIDKAYEGSIEGKTNSIGFVTQNNFLFSKWTVYENLAFIYNNRELINNTAELLSVEKLLEKYPNQISGGERQRVCIIRSLLNNPEIIVADEPAAALDSKNALIVAETFRKICSSNRTVIIATHKSCFDAIADEILFIDYGRLSSVQKKHQEPQLLEKQPYIGNNTNTKNSFFFTIKYLIKKNRDKIQFKNFCFISLFILVLLCCFSIKANFESEYAKIIAQKYPSDTLYVSQDNIEALDKHFDIKIYNNYIIKEDSFTVYGLFDKKDSGFSYGNMIKAGTFPDNDTQVLADENFIKNVLLIEDINHAVGKEITIKNRKFIISGVVPIINDNNTELIYCNLYYQPDEEKVEDALVIARVYMPYNVISQIGEPIDENFKMISIDGMYESKEEIHIKVKKILTEEPFSPWNTKIENIKGYINLIYMALLCIIFIITLIALLFQKNEIALDYYYRRKEIGGLRLFGVEKKRILMFLLVERLINCCLAIACSYVIFILICSVVYIIKNIWLFIPLLSMLLIGLFLILYNVLLVFISSRKILKEDIIKLICA